MKCIPSSLLCALCLAVLAQACRRAEKFDLASEGPPLGLAQQFTNLLARGSASDRDGAVRALGMLALESWDPSSQETAFLALLRAAANPDTNVQSLASRALSSFSEGTFLPSWSHAVISKTALRSLDDAAPLTRCAAAVTLLRFDRRQKVAINTLLSLLEHSETALRLQAGNALVEESARDGALNSVLLTRLRTLVNATNQGVRLDAVVLLWHLACQQSTLSAARVDAEEAIGNLLRSADVTDRRKASSLLLNSGRPITLPLQEAIAAGLSDSDPEVAVTMAFLANQSDYYRSPRPAPEPGTLVVLARALEHPNPQVRLAAVTPMSAIPWWVTQKRTEKLRSDGGVQIQIENSSADPLVLPALIKALDDPDLQVRLKAASTVSGLSELRESAQARLWQIVMAGLASGNPHLQQPALWLSSGLKDPPPEIGALIRAALTHTNSLVRRSALYYAGIPNQRRFRGDLKEWSSRCEDPDPSMRMDAGEYLAILAQEQGRDTNAPWSALPAGVMRLVGDPFPQVSTVGLAILYHVAAAANQTPVTLGARNYLQQMAAGTNACLKLRLGRYFLFPQWLPQQIAGFGSAPEKEQVLQILARASEPIVRRNAAVALNYLGFALPSVLYLDPDQEVARAVSWRTRRPTDSPVAAEDYDTLLRLLRDADPAKRRKAAANLAGNYQARQKGDVAAEAVQVLLETYTNAAPYELGTVNRVLVSLIPYTQSSPLYDQVLDFAVRTLTGDNSASQVGLWGLMSDLLRRSAQSPKTNTLLTLAPVALRQAHNPDAAVRIPVIQVLPTLQGALEAGGTTYKAMARESRIVLVEALSDREPAIAISAAVPFLETPFRRYPITDRIASDAELIAAAVSGLESRLVDPEMNVRQNMASALASLAARQSDLARVEKALASWQGLFAYPERVRSFLSGSSTPGSPALSQLELPSGIDVLQFVALRTPNPAIRQSAVRTLARLLEALSVQDDVARSMLDNLYNSTSNLRNAAGELEPLRDPLLKLVNCTNAILSQVAGKLLGRINPAGDAPSAGLVARAHSTDPAQRRSAMLELADPTKSSSEQFRVAARQLAVELVGHPDESVRIAALQAFGANILPDQNADRSAQLDLEPLVKALDDASQVVQETAFRVLSERLYVIPEANLAQLAPPMLKRMMTVREPERLYCQYNFGKLPSQLEDQSARERILLDTQERINNADNDNARANWLRVLGELHLAFDQPNEAVGAFQKAVRLAPNLAETLRPNSDKALQTADRFKEAALEPAPRPDYFEVQSRLQALAREQDVTRLVQVANRALDGYLPAYGGSRAGRGWGEHDQVIREVTRLLVSLRKYDALDEFLNGALKRYPTSPFAWLGRAQLRLAQDRKDEALALLEQEMAQHPWNYDALKELEQVCRQLKLFDRYEAILRGLVDQHPGEQPLCAPLVQIYVASGRTNEAQKVVEAFRTASAVADRQAGELRVGGNADAGWRYSALAGLLGMVGDLDGAIVAQRKALESQGGDRTSDQQRLAELYRQAGRTNELARLETSDPAVRLLSLQQQIQSEVESGRTDAALATARRILALDLEEAQKRQARDGLVDAFGNQQERLVPLFEEVLKQKPNDAQSMSLLARLHAASKDLKRAMDYAERAHNSAPEDREIHYLLAKTCYDAGQYSKTLELLTDAFRRDVKLQPPGWTLLAQPYPALSNTNLLQDLLVLLKKSLAKSSANQPADSLRSLAFVERLLGQHEQAAEHMRKLLMDSRGESSYDRPFVVQEYRLLGKLDEAIELCRQPTAQRSQYPSRQSDLCRLYQLKGMTNEAVAAFQAQHAAWLERLKSGQADAGAYNYLAWAYLQNRVLPAEALDLARKALALAPNDINIGDTLAWALMRNGEFPEALRRFVSALTLRPVKAIAKESAWNALFELAQTSLPETVWTPSMNQLEGTLRGESADLARLNLVRSRFHAQRGETAKADACRRASGYPKESAWRFLGPFANEGGAGFAHEFIPEGQAQVDLEAAYPTSVGPLRWKNLADEVSGGVVYLHALYPGLDWAVVYLALTIESDRVQQVQLRLGSDDQAKLWLNGTLVFGNPEGRPLVRDQNIVPVELRQGANQLLVKVCNERGDWAFTLRVAAPGGAPPTGVNF